MIEQKACFCSKHIFYLFHLDVLDLVHRKIFAFSREKQEREVSILYLPDMKRKKNVQTGTNTKHNKTHFSNFQVYIQRKCTIIFILFALKFGYSSYI